jgi:hypothetical protein
MNSILQLCKLVNSSLKDSKIDDVLEDEVLYELSVQFYMKEGEVFISAPEVITLVDGGL